MDLKIKGNGEEEFYTADTNSGNLIFCLGIYNG